MSQLNIDNLKVPDLKLKIKEEADKKLIKVKLTGLKKAELKSLLLELLSNPEAEKEIEDEVKAIEESEKYEELISYEEAQSLIEEYVGEDFFMPQKIRKEWLNKVIEALELLINDEQYEKIPTFIFYELINKYGIGQLSLNELTIALDYLKNNKVILIFHINEAVEYAKKMVKKEGA